MIRLYTTLIIKLKVTILKAIYYFYQDVLRWPIPTKNFHGLS